MPVARRTIGLDFGTTNTVAAHATGGAAEMIAFDGPHGPSSVFRSALCFWEDDDVRGGIASEAGPWAIAEYLAYPQGSRFLQSFKSVAASKAFEHATIFEKRYRFEDLGRLFLDKLRTHGGGQLDGPARVIVGRPVAYAGGQPDATLARQRYDAMFSALGAEVHYVYEPMGAAFSYAARLDAPATVLVADFGGGTSDFSVVRIDVAAGGRRCTPLGHAGIGIAGDRFDYRILDRLVLPRLGKGGRYRSFDKTLEIPAGWFNDFADWSRLALMRNRRTLAELDRLRRSALDPDAIGRMIAVIEHELGFPLYDAVGRLKRALSRDDVATFRFAAEGLTIETAVERTAFETWIAEDVARIEATVDRALDAAGTAANMIDTVFLTGGSSLIPRIRRIFVERFGEARIAAGDELTSIAHGLALIGQEDDIAAWTA